MSELRTAIVGALLVALGPISMALYTPALPALVEAYGVGESLVQMTVTVYFAGFALAQLLCGPLSDAYGRRKVALGFFTTYVLGSAIATVAPSIEWLLVARTVQGIGAAAGVAISRAIVRDLFVGQASARILNTIGIMLGIAPAIAPTLGGVLLTIADWHALFVVMLAYGLTVIALLAFIPETHTSPDPRLARPRRLLQSYATLLRDPTFMRSTLLLGLTLCGVYTVTAILPFIMIERVGLTPAEFGMTMLIQTGAFFSSSILTKLLLRRVEASRLVPVGLGLVVAAGALIFVLLRLVEPSVLSVMGPMAVWAFGIGLLNPGATTSALANFPKIAGAASSLLGFLQVGTGLLGLLIASRFTDPVEAFMTVLPAAAVAALIANRLLARVERNAELAQSVVSLNAGGVASVRLSPVPAQPEQSKTRRAG